MDFKKIGKNVTIYQPNIFINPAAVVLKDNILISEFCHFACAELEIGSYVHIAAFVSIAGGGRCMIGDFVGISAGVRLITGTEDTSGNCLTNPTIPAEYRTPIRSFVVCERHSVLFTNAIVFPGVTIGEGAVVGAGSIVRQDIEPWGVYCGNPVRKIKDRPKEKILEIERRLVKGVTNGNNYD